MDLRLVPWLGAGLAALPGLALAAGFGIEALVVRARERRRRAIEAELDRTQAELRGTILRLASELNGNGLEARKALIRESFLARGDHPSE